MENELDALNRRIDVLRGFAPSGWERHIPGNWSGDIAASWKLLEEMPPIVLWAPGGSVNAEEYVNEIGYWTCECNVRFSDDAFDRETRFGRGKTAPEAICRAYIAWREVTK